MLEANNLAWSWTMHNLQLLFSNNLALLVCFILLILFSLITSLNQLAGYIKQSWVSWCSWNNVVVLTIPEFCFISITPKHDMWNIPSPTSVYNISVWILYKLISIKIGKKNVFLCILYFENSWILLSFLKCSGLFYVTSYSIGSL